MDDFGAKTIEGSMATLTTFSPDSIRYLDNKVANMTFSSCKANFCREESLSREMGKNRDSKMGKCTRRLVIIRHCKKMNYFGEFGSRIGCMLCTFNN